MGIPLKPFDIYHILSLSAVILVVVSIYLFRDKLYHWKHEKAFRYTLGSFGIVWEIALHYWQFVHGIWTWADSAPIGLCSISLALGIYVIFTRSFPVFEIGYFWAIGGVVSILFPDIPYGPDRFRFYQYVLGHLNFFAMFMYMLFVHRYYPNSQSFKKSLLYLVFIVFIIVLPLNWLTDANFLFLIRADGTPFEIFEGHGYLLYLTGVIILSIIVMYVWYLPVKFFMHKSEEKNESIN